jgi:8-oxo-dGTP pyrophosphatase MutT (NUDIX family)
MTLDFKADREETPPKDAATVVLLRDDPNEGLVVFCVQRSHASSFMGGAVVFPGGKVDLADASPAWFDRVLLPEDMPAAFMGPHFVAAARETLEEAAILCADPAVDDAAAKDARGRLTKDAASFAALFDGARRRDARGFVPWSRWITPVAESRRFDARFFLAVAPEGQMGAHDTHETVRSFWARPKDVLEGYLRGDLTLFPPTHRTLEQLAEYKHSSEALAAAKTACLDPICPVLVRHASTTHDTMALVLPGDPEHAVKEPRSPGKSRFVMTPEGKWLPGDPPS